MTIVCLRVSIVVVQIHMAVESFRQISCQCRTPHGLPQFRPFVVLRFCHPRVDTYFPESFAHHRIHLSRISVHFQAGYHLHHLGLSRLWVAQKIDLQAWRAYSIFKYMKLKSYDKKLFVPNIFPTLSLKMNCQRVQLS